MKLKNEHGFTLPELLIGVFLVALLAYGFAMAMLQFVIGYQETRDYLKLQQEMLYVVDAIRHGYVKQGLNINQPLIGLLTAQKVSFNVEGSSITMVPVDGDFGLRYWARVHKDQNGRVLLSAQYGYQHLSNLVIFPSSEERIGRENKFQITELKFENLTPSQPHPYLVRFTVTGRVRFRERSRRQTQADDLRLNIKYAQFESTVYVGNADKNQ